MSSTLGHKESSGPSIKDTGANLRPQLPAQRETDGPQDVTQATVPALGMLCTRVLARALLLLGPHGPHRPPLPFKLVHGAVNKGSVARQRTPTGRCQVVSLGARAVHHACSVLIVLLCTTTSSGHSLQCALDYGLIREGYSGCRRCICWVAAGNPVAEQDAWRMLAHLLTAHSHKLQADRHWSPYVRKHLVVAST